MNWLEARIALFDLATSLMQFAVNWLLQSTLLISAGLLVAFLLRRRGSAIQSVVYRTTLAAVLLCPLATLAMSLAEFEGWSIKLPAGWSYEEVAIAPEPARIVESANPQDELFAVNSPAVAELDRAAIPIEEEFSAGPVFAPQPADNDLRGDATATLPANPLPEAASLDQAADASSNSPLVATRQVFSLHLTGIVCASALCLWAIVTTLFAVRLGASWWQLSRLRRTAIPADSESIGTCHALSVLLQVSPPEVLRSPFLPSPCLAGITRPAVLLPEEEGGLSLREVLVHELAHLARRDCHWSLLQRLGTALFFFQPLLWVLARRIEMAAEEVCDDYVVQYGGDRQQYAHRLVDIAELSTSPLALAGVGIVSLRSMLARRVARIMDTSRTLSTRVSNLLLVLVMAGGLVGATAAGLVGLGSRATEAETNLSREASDEPENSSAPGEPDGKDDEIVHFYGTVTRPDGKPLAGARVTAIEMTREDISWLSTQRVVGETTSRHDGTYELDVPAPPLKTLGDSNFVQRHLEVVADVPGLAPDFWSQGSMKAGDPFDFELRAAGEPIEGRVIDIEGQGVAGARVKVRSLSYEDPWKDRVSITKRLDCADLNLIPVVMTDADGRFRFEELGANTRATIEVEGPTIAKAWIEASTENRGPVPQEAPPPSVPNSNDPRDPSQVVFGRTFDYVAEPTQRIAGIVRDAVTGEPLAGVSVGVYQYRGSLLAIHGFVSDVTDDEGRYELVGLPKPDEEGRPISLRVTPPASAPYFRTKVEVPKSTGLDTARCDIELEPAVWVSGRVVDEQTGEPIEALVSYYPFLKNENAARYANFNAGLTSMGHDDRYATDTDGKFRIPAVPGRGVLTAIAVNAHDYEVGHGANEIEGLRGDKRLQIYHLYGPELTNALREVDIPPEENEVEADIPLAPLDRRDFRMTDTAGNPVENVLIAGTHPYSAISVSSSLSNSEATKADTATLFGLQYDGQRLVLFLNKEKRLGWAGVIKPDAPGPIELEPCATIMGRIKRGEEPLESGPHTWITAEIPQTEMPEPARGGGWRTRSLWVQSKPLDADGRFELDQIVPGANYELKALGEAFAIDTVAPGETIDLGTIDVTTDERPEPVRTTPGTTGLGPNATDAGNMAEEAEVEDNDSETSDATDDGLKVVRGVVLDPQGAPLKNATIEVQQWIHDPEVPKEPLASTESSSAGEFELTYPTTHSIVTFVASAEGFGAAFVREDQVQPGESLKLQLVEDDVAIRGRVIDLEGNPLEGVAVQIGGVATPREETLDDWFAAIEQGKLLWEASEAHIAAATPQRPRNLPDSVTTVTQGHFTIRGVGRERQLKIVLQGPTIAYTEATVVTRKMQPVVAIDGVRDPEWSRKHTVYGSDFEIVAPPTQPITGIVRDAVTGEPLAGVAIESYRMTSRGVSQKRVLRSTSDQQGRYTLVGMPKSEGNQIMAVPNDSQPYLMREFDVPDRPGLEPIELDLELHRGVWIRGQVTDRETGQPLGALANAYVHYYPYLSNPYAQALPEYDDDGNVDGYQNHYKVGDDGRFRLVGLPGQAIVGVSTWGKPIYPKGQGSELIGGADKYGHFPTYRAAGFASRKSPNVMREVDIPEGRDEFLLDFELGRGRSIRVTPVNPAGELVHELKVAGVAHSQYWTGVEASPFEVTALAQGEERTLLIHHAGRKIGRVVQLSEKDSPDELKVELRPCVTIKGRLVDDNEQPMAAAKVRLLPGPGGDYRPELQEVFTDENGRFVHDAVLSGATYWVLMESVQIGYAAVAKDLVVAPGETIDLGTIDVTTDERPEPVRTKPGATAAKDTTIPEGEVKDVGDASPTAAEFAGKVVDPSGQPAAGAKLFLVFHIPEPTGLLTPTWKPVAVCDQSGAFRFMIGADDFGPLSRHSEFQAASLVAVKEGFGFGWSTAGFHTTDDSWLKRVRENIEKAPAEMQRQLRERLKGVGQPIRLVEDSQPLRGRVVDINGQPVAGVRFTLTEVSACLEDDLAAWREAAAEPQADFFTARRKTPRSMNGPQLRSLVTPAVTDANGEFVLTGVGAGRIVELLMTGPGVESAKILARTEPGEAIKLMRERRSVDLGFFTYHPAEFTIVAGPSTPITGTVRDSQTGEPLAGVTVKSQTRHGEPISGWGQDFVRAVTDEGGRYRLEGMPIGGENRIAGIAPRGELPYFSQEKRAATTPGGDPVEIDFEMVRGVWLEGRITDKHSGKGLSGRLAYYVADGNQAQRIARGFVDERDRLQSDDEGRFRIAVLPGPGYLAFEAHAHQDYPRVTSVLTVEGTSRPLTERTLKTQGVYVLTQNYHLLAEIDPPATGPVAPLELQLGDDNKLVGKVVGPSGKPVTDYFYSGRNAEFPTSWDRSEEGQFTLLGYAPGTSRHLYVVDQEHNLAAHMLLDGEQPAELVVQLQPVGHVRGRLVDEDGAPVANCRLLPWSPPIRNPMEFSNPRHVPPLPPNRANLSTGEYETDDEGRFEIHGLVPGVEYRVQARQGGSMTSPPTVSGLLDVVIKVETGESKDLGDVRLADELTLKKQLEGKADEKDVDTTSSSQVEPLIKGQITGPDGRPAAGMHVAVVARPNSPRRGGDFSPGSAVLAEGVTDREGRFSLAVKSETNELQNLSAVMMNPQLITRGEDSGIAWAAVDLKAPSSEIDLQLPAEQLITGRLVDLEGQPASRVTLKVQAVIKTAVDGVPSREGVGYQDGVSHAAWVPPVTSDEEGRFTLHGVPKDHGVLLDVEGDDRFAPQDISLNTGMPEQRGERDGTYRPLVRNREPGEETVLPLAPAQIFEGVVTYADTGQPAPHARLTIFATQQEQAGSWVGVAGQADSRGRYRISPKPGIRFRVTAYPPDGAPYLARTTPLDEPIRWRDGEGKREHDMALPKGVLIEGRVVEAGTEKPVAGASIQYIPESESNPYDKDEILTGWQAVQVSNDQGEFNLAVLPGPGTLLIHGPGGKYVVRETSNRQLDEGKPGRTRQYANAIERINPEQEADTLSLTVELTPGEQVRGEIVDPAGLPVDEVLVLTWLNVSPTSPYWRGHTEPTLGGRFELNCLTQGEEYRVHFLNPKRRIGGTAVLSSEDPTPRIVLQPCGAARLRLVDAEGQPVPGGVFSVHLAMRPGAYKYDDQAMRRGEIAADTDFISNVDPGNNRGAASNFADDEGYVDVPVLIPGATYWVVASRNGNLHVAKEFVASAGETTQLGDIVVDVNED